MATLNNSIIESMTKRASQPIQYQPNAIAQAPAQQQQPRLPQPYTHSFNRAPVMRDGVLYKGTHTMAFGNNQTAQRLDNGIAKDSRYSQPVQQYAAQQPGYGHGSGGISYVNANGTITPQSILSGILAAGRQRSDRAELAMQRTVMPMANRRNAMEMLNLAMDYNNKQQAMDDQRSYQNSMVDVQREQNRIANRKIDVDGALSGSELQLRYGGAGAGSGGIDPVKMMEMRNKNLETMVQSAPDYESQNGATKAMIAEEYLKSGRLPHRYWDDNGVIRPVYYRTGALAQRGQQQQQQPNERWVTR